MSASTEMTTATPRQTGVATANTRAPRFSDEQIAAAAINDATSELPSIVGKHIKPSPIGLSVEYWSPEKEGETKHVWVLGIENREVIDMESGEAKLLECVLMVQHTDDSKLLRYYSASKILVGTIRSAIERGEIIPSTLLTPVAITYTGLKRTKSGRNAARWEVRPLIVAVQ